MRKFTIWTCLCFLIPAVLFTTGCEPDVPTKYPEIELPLAQGMNTSMVVDDIMEIPPSKLWHKTIDISPALSEVRLAGWCVASGGARNDIKVLFLDDVDFHNWRNFNEVEGLYKSEKINVATIDVRNITPGKYHLIFSNWFSEFSSKKVIAKVYLYWTVKPVSFEISNGLEMPQGANVTLEFNNAADASSFKASFEQTPVSVNATGPEVKFTAPTIGTYDYSYVDNTTFKKGQFEVFSPEPGIGRGFTVSSSMANSPPRLEEITYDVDRPFENFSVKAIDPDDDDIHYYAFNVPMAISGKADEGYRTWRPAATLDEDSGEFEWNGSSANLSKGEYTVHFEVSDGILSDSRDIVIAIK